MSEKIEAETSKDEQFYDKKVGSSGVISLTSSIEEYDEFKSPPTVDFKFDEEKINDFYNNLDQDSLDFLRAKTGHGVDIDSHNHELTFDIKFFLTKVLLISNEQTLEHFAHLVEEHDDDVNFPKQDLTRIKDVVSGVDPIDGNAHTNFKAKLLSVLIYFHSPYPEVRSVTSLVDDDQEPIETVRSYTIGIIWLILSAGIGEFFSHRQPAITLSTSVCAVLMYPCGKLWQLVMPNINLFGVKSLPLNPGPYGFKEQVFATLIVTSAYYNVYVSYNIVSQTKFYDQTWISFGYQFLLCISTQFMGFSFAGILRKFVIYPSRAVWPTTLPTIALNRSLLLRDGKKEKVNGWTITSYKFFWTVFGCMFLYFWIPDYLFQALSSFNWMTWIAPNNFNLAMVTGTVSGLGLNPIPTFDWNVASAITNPLTVPFVTSLNIYIGGILGYFMILGVYYSNYKWTAYLPINSNSLFTNTGEVFKITKVLTDNDLDLEKYQNYSPPFYSAANIVLYSAYFFVYPFTFLYNGYIESKTIKRASLLIYEETKAFFKDFSFKKALQKKSSKKTLLSYNDPHSRIMSKYEEVPDWAFLVTLLVSLALSIVLVKAFPETKTPVWGIFFVIGLNFVFLVPFTLLYAVTGSQYGLNVLVELIVGYAINNGTALMTLKALGYNIDGQAENFVSAQKTAYYTRIPPRALFRAQFIGTFIQVLVFLGVVNWSLSNIENFCESDQAQHFTCPNERTYSAAASLWGSIGPKIVFDGLYPAMKYSFLIGFLAALLFIGLRRYFPKLMHKNFEPAVMVSGILNYYAPYNLGYVTSFFYVSFCFMYLVKNRYPSWFSKFTYVLSAALSSSVAFSAIIIFFAVQYHAKPISWWGNNVSYAGIDGGVGQQALYDITATVRGYFGPERGKYPTNQSV